ncbi:hypothetical protein Pmani_010216 [Petrolisthes manimaculis]|uniref:Uncharacterized protein n=1 Tax=Petrolisthes manimaculis TaxID=1843537 RepID=A0AAE1Q2N4_9EUCA|nr:hypothetical protein Pmani_010216 [Petrolisthes manimaculis]
MWMIQSQIHLQRNQQTLPNLITKRDGYKEGGPPKKQLDEGLVEMIAQGSSHSSVGLKLELQKQLQRRFPCPEKVFNVGAATQLDPRFKKVPLVDQSTVNGIEDRLDIVDGTSLVYSGFEDGDGMLTHFLHDGSEGVSPASSSSPHSSSSGIQQAGSSRVMPGCSTNTGGVNHTRPPLCSPAPKSSRTTPKPETPTASNRALEILESTCTKSSKKHKIAFGLYQMIEQDFKKISEKTNKCYYQQKL